MPDPAAQVEAGLIRDVLFDLVGRLPKRLRQVIVGRYGLGEQPPCTLKKLGQELGLTGERVRQLQQEALAWLRHPAHSQELRALLRRHSQQEYEWAEELAQAWLRQRGGRCQDG